MAIEKARAYLREKGFEDRIREFDVSSATVELAAAALGVDGSRIAKTMSFMTPDGPILVVAAGDVKIDNAKFKGYFHTKAKMLTPDEVDSLIGHSVGGVCPFGINDGVKVYVDISVRRFEKVYPACGNSASAVELTPDELYEVSDPTDWVDVCRERE